MAQTDVKVVISLEDKVSKNMPNITGSIIKANIALEAVRVTGKFVFNQLMELGKAGTQMARLEKTLQVVQERMDISADTISRWKNELAAANVFGAEANEAMLTFAQSGLAAAGVSLEKFTLMSKDFAASIGVSSLQGVKDFTKAIGTMRPELLDKYRLTFNLNQVYKEQAVLLGKTVVEMTAQEKRLALLNYLYDQHSKTVDGVYKKTYDTANKAISSVADASKALRDNLGLMLEPAIQQVATVFRDLIQNALKWILAHEQELKNWANTLGENVGNAVAKLGKAVGWLKDNKEIVLSVLAAWGLGIAVLAIKFGAMAVAATLAWIAAAAPVLLVIVALAALGIAVGLVWKHFDTMKAKAEELGNKFTEFKDDTVATFTALGEKFTNFFSHLNDLLAVSAEDWAFYFGTLVADAVNAWNNFQENWRLFWEGVSITAEEQQKSFGERWRAWLERTKNNLQIVHEQMRTLWDNFWNKVRELTDRVLAIITGIIDYAMDKGFKGLIKSATEAVKAMWNKFWDSMLGKTRDTINDILGWINNLINKMNDLKNKFKEGFDFKIKSRAVGGFVQPSDGPILVGERGPELFVPPTAGTVIPNSRIGPSGQGGATVNINFSVGMYAGSELEKRIVAENLYRSLVDYAQSQDTTVASLFGA